MYTWQQWQSSFRPSKTRSLLQDEPIDETILLHMSLMPLSGPPSGIPDEALAFLPLRHNNNRAQQNEFELSIAGALPLVPLRRDHSDGGAPLRF
jgi:hypothetical protein